MQQTATQAAVHAALSVAKSHATETAVSIEAQNKVLQGQATRTAIALKQSVAAQAAAATAAAIELAPVLEKKERDDISNQQMILIGSSAGGILFLSASLGIFFLRRGQARVGEAKARMYKEQRHTLQVQASIMQQSQQHLPSPMRLLPETKRVHKEPQDDLESAA